MRAGGIRTSRCTATRRVVVFVAAAAMEVVEGLQLKRQKQTDDLAHDPLSLSLRRCERDLLLMPSPPPLHSEVNLEYANRVGLLPGSAARARGFGLRVDVSGYSHK